MYAQCKLDYNTVIYVSFDETLGTVSGNYQNGEIKPRPACNEIIKIVDNVLSIGSLHIVATPKESTPQYEYRFNGWNVQDGDVVYEEMEIVANFERVERTYNVKVEIGDTTNELTVAYGTEVLIEGNKITIGNTTFTASQTGKTFKKWIGAVGVIEGAITIVAEFE